MFGEEMSDFSNYGSEADYQEFYGEEEMKPENVKCPDCNGEMVSRTGKFGVFWGCKAFPACKGTRDSMGRSKADREKWKAEQQKTTDGTDLVNDDSISEDGRDMGFRWNKK